MKIGVTFTFDDLNEMKEFTNSIHLPEKKTNPNREGTREATQPVAQAGTMPTATPHPGVQVGTIVPDPAVTAPQKAAPVYAVPQMAAPVAPQTVAPVAPQVPTTEKSYTLDDLARAGMTLMDSGRQADLLGLLSQFGVAALPALPKEQYGAFATALRGLGAKI